MILNRDIESIQFFSLSQLWYISWKIISWGYEVFSLDGYISLAMNLTSRLMIIQLSPNMEATTVTQPWEWS